MTANNVRNINHYVSPETERENIYEFYISKLNAKTKNQPILLW